MAMDWQQHNTTLLSQVHPLLAYRVDRFLGDMLNQGIPCFIVRGLASSSEQAALYAKGRTPEQIANHVRLKGANGSVTDAPPGYSSHEFGLAVDVCPDDPNQAGLQLDWNIAHPVWKQMLATAPKYDLAEGANWPRFHDNPHLYLKELNDTPTDAMRAALASGGLTAVWAMISPLLPPVPENVAADPEAGT